MDGLQTRPGRLGRAAAEFRLQAAAIRLLTALKAGFRPQQPRSPRGNPDGGQWTLVPGYAQVQTVSRRRAGGTQIQIGGVWHTITPAQQMLLAQSAAARRTAIRAAQRLDPNWRPPPQAYSTPDGMIAANRAVEQAARQRIFEVVGGPMGIGPYAREWIAAPPTNRRLNRAEQREIDRLGRKWGCHQCGTTNPGTRSGGFIGDHQNPKGIGRPDRIFPHCRFCSNSQGGLLRWYLQRKIR